MKHEFDDIRPYYDEEVAPTIRRLLEDPEFKRVMRYVLPAVDWEKFKSIMLKFNNKKDFQSTIIRDAVYKIVGKTAVSFDASGFENVEKSKAYTYISNHRDIVLDASILCALLLGEGYDTTEIAIGDNLLIQPWIRDLVRLNKSFLVKRGVSMRQMLEVSSHLSKYIHYTISEKNQSVWIAQREGRAKNSDDRTQDSLLKMLSLGGGKDFLASMAELHITPVSISYEFDPCDFLKAKEFQMKRDDPEFKKTPKDDLINMETGLFGFKGRIHFQIGRCIDPFLEKVDKDQEKSAIVSSVAALVDREIFLNYRFYPVNYIAYDRLWGGSLFSDHYTKSDEAVFEKFVSDRLNLIDLPNKDIHFLTDKLMEMYAFPVKNYLSVKES